MLLASWVLEKDQSEAGNASIPSMYVSKTDGGHQAAYPNGTKSLVGCRKAPFHSASDKDERLHGL